MRTLKTNVTGNRIALLAQKEEKIFHTRDLANYWGMADRNTLRVTLKRYCDAGLLHRIYRGFYALRPTAQLEPTLLGAKALSRYCYVSTETILYEEAYIQQPPSSITLVSELSRHFIIGEYRYRSRKLADKFLYNSAGLTLHEGVKKANFVRAIADLLYFNPRFHFDHEVDWTSVQAMQKEVGYPLTPSRYVTAETK